MKTCAKCGVEKALDQFGRYSSAKDGLDSWCRTCRRDYRREQMRRLRKADPKRAKERSRIDRERLKKDDPDYHRRWYWANAEKERERAKKVMRANRAAHPEQERARKQRYRATHLEKVRKAEREKTYARRALQPFSPELAELMAELITRPCSYCGTTENISIDHIEPLSRGGKHEADNLAPACLPCNCSKNDLLLSEWSGRAAA